MDVVGWNINVVIHAIFDNGLGARETVVLILSDLSKVVVETNLIRAASASQECGYIMIAFGPYDFVGRVWRIPFSPSVIRVSYVINPK